MYSIDIKDSTLKEISYKNNIHYLQIAGDYLPIQYPTKNEALNGNNFPYLNINKVFIATNDYIIGDSYNIFGKTLKLLNKDLKIVKGDYIKAEIDFKDMTIKITNLSRLYYTPKTVLSDIEFSHNKMVEETDIGNSTELFNISIRCNENTDIYINSSVYVDMGKGEVHTSLWCDEIDATEALCVSTYTSNIPKRAAVQNGYCIKDAKKDNVYTIRLVVEYTLLEKIAGHNNECIFVDMSSNIFFCAKDIELNYPCYNDTFYYEEHADHIRLLYLKSYPDDFVIPETINGKPVTTINQIMFYKINGNSINLDNITNIEDGAFFKSNIKEINLPSNGNEVLLGTRAFAYSNVKEVVINNNCNIKTIPYRCFSGTKLDKLDIQSNTEILEPYSFSSTTISEMNIGPSVKEMQENSFSGSIDYNVTLSEGIEILYHDGSIYDDVVIPNSVQFLSLRSVFGNIDFSKLSESITELIVKTRWINKSYPLLVEDLENKVITSINDPGAKVGYYDNVVIPEAIDVVDLGRTYCDNLIIESRDKPLIVKNLDVYPYAAVPRYKFENFGNASVWITCLTDENDIHPIDLSNIELYEEEGVEYNHKLIPITSITKNLNGYYTLARILAPKYMKKIPTSLHGYRWSVYGSYQFQTNFFAFHGVMCNIPETDVIYKGTYQWFSMYNTETSNNANSVECIICRKIESRAFESYYYTSSTGYYGDYWYRAFIGYGCEEIETDAFYYYQNLTRFYVPPTVTKLGNNAFHCGWGNYSTSTYQLYLPNTLSGISNTGYYRANYNIVYYDATYQSFYNFTDGTDASTITGFKNSNAYIGTWVIPETHNDLPVTTLNAIFNGNTLESLIEVVINAKITTIVSNTFKNCKKLMRVIVPDSVTSITSYAFYGCIKLNRLEFRGCKITSIGANAFEEVGHTTDVYSSVPSNRNYYGTYEAYNKSVLPLLRVNNNAFGTIDYYRQDMSRYNLEITDEITAIGASAFKNSIVPVGKIKVPENDTYKIIEQYTFYGAPYITELYVPDTITTINANAFVRMYGCKKIRIGSSTTVNTTFEGCEMLEVLDWTVNKLSANMFKNCHSLKSITISSTITSIPNNCFDGCDNLETVILEGEVSVGNYAFNNCKNLTTIDATKIKSVGTYAFQNTNLDNNTVNALLSKNLTNEFLFAGDTNITEINIPSGYTLGISEFENCSNLSIVNSSGITNIPNRCFYNTKLDTNSIKAFLNSTTKIGEYSFAKNPLMSKVDIPSTITSIGAGAFSECTKLKSFTWNTSVNIPNYCFQKSSLAEMTTFPTVDSYGDFCFSYTDIVGDIEIPTAVYGKEVFRSCKYIENVNMVDTGKHEFTFGSGMFLYCYELQNVSFESTIKTASFYAGVFEYCRKLSLNLDFYNKFDNVNLLGGQYSFTSEENESKYVTSVLNTICLANEPYFEDLDELVFTTEFYHESSANFTVSAFSGRSVKRVTFNKSIPTCAFYYYGSIGVRENEVINSRKYIDITDITLGPDFKKIDSYGLANMTAGTNVGITIHNNTTSDWTIADYGFGYSYSSYANLKLYVIDLKNCTSIGKYAFGYCTNLTTVKNMTVESLSDYAFYTCSSLKNIDISTVTSFGQRCFDSSGIVLNEANRLNPNVELIDAYCFYNCSSVTNVIFDDNAHLTRLGNYAFAKTSLTNIHFPTVAIDEFNWSGLSGNLLKTSIWDNDPKYVKLYYMQYVDFSGYNDGVYIIPDTCTTIFGNYTFRYSTGITELVIPDTVTTLCENSTANIINGSSITTVTFSGNRSSLDTVKSYYLSSSTLTTVNLPNSITSIPQYFCNGCTALTTINIPEECTEIGQYAFYNCPKLTEVRLSPKTMSVGYRAFYNFTGTIYLSKDCVVDSNAFNKTHTTIYYEDL